MRGAGVQHFRCRIAQGRGHRGGVFGGVVGQTQDDKVDVFHDRAARAGVAAAFGRQAFHGDRGKRGQTFADPETRGA